MREVEDTAKVTSKTQKVNTFGSTLYKVGKKYDIKQKI